MAIDTSSLRAELKLINNNIGQAVDLLQAITAPPSVTQTIDGASVLAITLADHKRDLIRWDGLDTRSWASTDGVNYELVGISKSGDSLTLTFEDAIVAALRRHTKPLSAPAMSTTRRGFAVRLCREARVPYLIDPAKRRKVQNPLQRSTDGQRTSSWDVLGSDVAQPIGWRRFSDGRRLVMGSDAWLTSHWKPIWLRENTGGVSTIDFDLDVAKRASTAKVVIDTRVTRIPIGTPVGLSQLGPADGLWLVSEFARKVTGTRGDLVLTRAAHVLKEPKRQGGNPSRGSRDKDSGDRDNIPGQQSNGSGIGRAGNPARERMVQYALRQRGKPYVWGASGPSSFDCSGLVQAATAHAGKRLGKPSASQWDACVRAHKTISVRSALKIRGALLFRIGGEFNHVAISLGDGTTMEAKGSAYGCGVFRNAADGGWTGAALWL